MPEDPALDEERARGRFDRAVAYWNAGRFWHAHEDWEDLWNEAHGAHRLWLQGLIQYAAAFVHFDRGFYARGFARLMEQATEKVRDYAGPTHHLDWPRLERDLAPWTEHGRRVGRGEELRASAPGDPPHIHYVPGYVPDPLPPEEDDQE